MDRYRSEINNFLDHIYENIYSLSLNIAVIIRFFNDHKEEICRYVIIKGSPTYISDDTQPIQENADEAEIKRTIINYINESCEISLKFNIEQDPAFYTEKSNLHGALVKLDDALNNILSCEEIDNI